MKKYQSRFQEATMFYGFEFWGGKNTTTGDPHPKTGRMNIAGEGKAFKTKEERDDWVNSHNRQNRTRIATSASGLRDFKKGESIEAFKEYLKYLQFDAEYRDQEYSQRRSDDEFKNDYTYK